MSPSYVRDLRSLIGHRLLLLPSVAAAIVHPTDESRILLTEDISVKRWTFPGGAIEPGETPADAVVREIREELGVLIEPLLILGVFGGFEFVVEYPNGDRAGYVLTLFDCRIVDGEISPDGIELAAARFVTLDEAFSMRISPWMRHVILGMRRGRSAARFDPPSPSVRR